MIKELLVYKHSLEINPEQLKENEKLDENLVFLEVYVDKFMSVICKSAETYPPYAGLSPFSSAPDPLLDR